MFPYLKKEAAASKCVRMKCELHCSNETHPDIFYILRGRRYPSDCRGLYYLDFIELVLFILFCIELLCRVLAHGLSGISKPWIVFDALVVVSSSSLYIYQHETTSTDLSPGSVSTLRIFRVVRVQHPHLDCF
jgi:hypothetical protein